MVNLVHSVEGQLQLDDTVEAFQFVWVAVSTKGTIVKLDAKTGQVLGEYRTAPEGQPTNPSRTTVDHNGAVWAGNRAGNSVVHVGLEENNGCIDRNGNGRIDTSSGLNDVLPWSNAGGIDTSGGVDTASDECIVHYTRVRASGTRHVSVTRDNDVWVSGTEGQQFDLIDGDTGDVVRTEPSVGFGGYGGLIDGNGVIWSSRPLLHWDTSRPLTGPNGGNWTGYPHDSYGLCIDSQGDVWNTSEFGGEIRQFSPDGILLGTYSHGDGPAQGCAVGLDDHVWVAHSNRGGTTVGHLRPDGTYVGSVSVGAGPTGLSADANGKIWVTNYNSQTVSRIDPTIGQIGQDGVTRVGQVDFTTVNLGGQPYNYSDMTGSTLTGTPDTGTWNVTYDSEHPDTAWGPVVWAAEVFGDGELSVQVASSTNGADFGPDVAVVNGASPVVGAGRYLRVSVHFTRSSMGESPILHELTLSPACAPPTAPTALPTRTPSPVPSPTEYTPPGCVSSPEGIVSRWPLDGVAEDVISYNDGTLHSGATFGPGHIGESLVLDGVDDHMSTDLDAQPSAMRRSTWEAWIFPSRADHTADQYLMSIDDGNFDRSLFIRAGTNLFGVNNGRGWWEPTQAIPDRWQHIAVVFTPEVTLFYHNGVRYASGLNIAEGPSNNRFTLGRNPAGGGQC
jgi:hypothetical protein